jgi:serine/threonine-protein kinase RsbW
MASSDQIQFHLSIDSRFENIELVQVVLNDTLERLGLADDARHWVDLATREAVANAIKHGNRGETGKRVDIRMSVDGEELILSVSDQGEGFNPGEVVDPLAPENLLRPNGRGLFYMQSFMDRVEFDAREGGGTVVTLRKRLFGSAETRTASREAARKSDSGGDG